jgi:carboxypeptidase Q
MKKNLAVFICMLLPVYLLAQQEPVNQEMIQKIRSAAFQQSQVPFIAHYLTDVSGPRLTNAPGYRQAAKWAVETMRQWGLKNAALEPWGEFGRGWSVSHSYAALKTPYYQPLIAYPRAWTAGTKGPVKGRVIILDSLTVSAVERLGDSLKGKIVLLHARDTLLKPAFEAFATRYADSELDTLPDKYMGTREEMLHYLPIFKKQREAKRRLATKGALALLSLRGTGRDGTLMNVDGQAGYNKDYALPLPEMVIAAEDLLRIRRLMKSSGNVSLELDIRCQWYTDDLKGYNVVAEIPGADKDLKDQVVMLGGHLDSWHSATGATDNAAGCVVMMEAVRILRALGVQPRRTIRIALWGGEEQGLLGSFGYVKKHFGDPADMQLRPEQKKVSAYFNLDNGSGKIRGVFLQNNEAVRPIFSSWLQPFADLGATGVTSSNTGSTDHIAFDAVGIPGFQFIQDPLEYETRTHHSNMDTYDHLEMEDLKQAAAVVAAFVYNAAMRDEMIPRKPLPAPGKFLFDLDEPL